MTELHLYCPADHRIEPLAASEPVPDDSEYAYRCKICGIKYRRSQLTERGDGPRCSVPGCTRTLDVLEFPGWTIYTCDLHPERTKRVRRE